MSDRDDQAMRDYYRERAPVYDRVYSYPERQEDIRYLEQYVVRQFAGATVLEIAAGTGYWTQFIAQSAAEVLATDVTVEALSQVHQRPACESVLTAIADAYRLGCVDGRFDACFAGLWFSHVPVERRITFIEQLRQVLSSGANVLFIDNSVAQCDRLPITHTDDNGNTYQDRTLETGQTHRVLKNFPTQQELEALIGGFGEPTDYQSLDHYWLFRCQFIK